MEAAGEPVDDWRPDPPPPCFRHLWKWFGEINRWRRHDGGKPCPLDLSVIEAWARLTARQLNSYELYVIGLLDLTYLQVFYSTESAGSNVAQDMAVGLRMMSNKKPDKKPIIEKRSQ